MVANTSPIYTLTPDLSTNNGTGLGTALTTAAADYTGVSANNQLEHTAGANGSFVRKLRFKALGGNVATVARVYINNGSTPTVGTNNTFIGEVMLPLTTASATAPTPDIDYPMEIALPPGFRLYVGLGTTVAAGWNCVAIGGQY